MTAKIKLNASSGGGSVSIQAPSSMSNNRVITLPDLADGTLVTSQSTLDATNLIVHDAGSKPTESDCTNGLAALQAAWDLENNSYKSQRKAEYPSIEDQLDTIYHSGVAGWKTTIKAIKDKYPKP